MHADESILERLLVAHIAQHHGLEKPATMPVLGELIIETMGFSMKGHLYRFLAARPHLFSIEDDPRQHVLLQSGALDAVGLALCLPTLPDDLQVESAATGHVD